MTTHFGDMGDFLGVSPQNFGLDTQGVATSVKVTPWVDFPWPGIQVDLSLGEIGLGPPLSKMPVESRSSPNFWVFEILGTRSHPGGGCVGSNFWK